MPALQIAHDIPGRLRLRVPRGIHAEGALSALTAQAGIHSYRWSPRTRSLLLLYDPERGTREAVHAAVAHALGLDRDAAPPVVPAPAAAAAPGGAFALGVHDLMGEADAGVQRATRGLLSLGGLLPLVLTAWALTEVVRGRAAPLAWSTALWYAHGLFRDYQVPASEN
jgi:Heavy metal associated domain 2